VLEGAMDQKASNLTYGVAPGIRFACLLDGQGGCTELSEHRCWSWHHGDGLLWIHLEREDPDSRRWLTQSSGLDPMIIDALLAEESRPRVESYGDSLMMVLRGVNHIEKEEPEDLVPAHIWVDKDRVISVRDKGQVLWALRDIRESLALGHGPSTAGTLFTQIVEKITRDLEPLIDEIEEEIDDLDESLTETPRAEVRKTLSTIRRHSTKLRRWIAPQREAMYRLHHEEMSWLNPREQVRLREVTDRLLRYIESLDSARDRATILHDDLTSLVSEQIGRNSYRLTAVAAVLLPPTLITGMFGQNLGGLWGGGEGNPWAFTVAVAAEIGMMPLVWWLLRRAGWL
jgi:zinc transporter